MNTKLLFSCLICGLFLSPATQAKTNSDVQTHKYQQVCKGKMQGDQVSFAYRGIIWNGTCEPQFFPSSKKVMLKGDEAELNSICHSDTNATSMNIEGHEIKGKCALGFTAPRPK